MLKDIRLFSCICMTAFCGLTASCIDDNLKNLQSENKATNLDSTIVKEMADRYKNGQLIFNKFCSSCHYPPEKRAADQYLFDDLFDRLPEPSEEYFITFIDDSRQLVEQKDAYALKLLETWDTNFEHHFKDSLTKAGKEDLITYLKIAVKQKLKRQ